MYWKVITLAAGWAECSTANGHAERLSVSAKFNNVRWHGMVSEEGERTGMASPRSAITRLVAAVRYHRGSGNIITNRQGKLGKYKAAGQLVNAAFRRQRGRFRSRTAVRNSTRTGALNAWNGSAGSTGRSTPGRHAGAGWRKVTPIVTLAKAEYASTLRSRAAGHHNRRRIPARIYKRLQQIPGIQHERRLPYVGNGSWG